MGVTVVTSDATIRVNTSQRVISTLPVGWDQLVAAFGRGYNYPKPTGQTTVFRTGDDADIEATVFAPVRVANSLKIQNSKVTFDTLGNTNSFGNLNVFTDILGGQDFAGNGDLAIDNDTGLMWYRNFFPIDAGGFNSIIDAALASTQGGFSNWFLPSIKQYGSVQDLGASSAVFLKALGNTTFGSVVLSSTTRADVTANAHTVNNQLASISSTSKTTTIARYYICRKHF